MCNYRKIFQLVIVVLTTANYGYNRRSTNNLLKLVKNTVNDFFFIIIIFIFLRYRFNILLMKSFQCVLNRAREL
jgi:hypothetical protein